MQAAIDDQLALGSSTEATRLFGGLMAFRTCETTWMKVLDNPRNTAVMIKKVCYWEFHLLSLPLPHTVYR